jgi:hypothetical protein
MVVAEPQVVGAEEGAWIRDALDCGIPGGPWGHDDQGGQRHGEEGEESASPLPSNEEPDSQSGEDEKAGGPS